MSKKVLLGTTNKGKITEIRNALGSLPFIEFVTLDQLDTPVDAPDEPFETLEQNALHKAKYYAEKTDMITLSGDSGLFVDALGGWPGEKSARVGETDDARIDVVLEKMKNEQNRAASFRDVLCLYDPEKNESFLAHGRCEGEITEEIGKLEGERFCYDPIFFATEAKKLFGEMTTTEKNTFSHRGKSLSRVKYHLQNSYAGKHIVVPTAVVVKDGKVLMGLRHDPHNPKHHNKWELPGGTVEMDETPEENVVRETEEETGYKVEIVSQINNCFTRIHEAYGVKYKIFLLTYVCKPISEQQDFNDEEMSELKWFEPDELTALELLPRNEEYLEQVLPEIKQVSQEHNL